MSTMQYLLNLRMAFRLAVILGLLPPAIRAQQRDFHAGRIVLDDSNGNTLTIQTPAPLPSGSTTLVLPGSLPDLDGLFLAGNVDGSTFWSDISSFLPSASFPNTVLYWNENGGPDGSGGWDWTGYVTIEGGNDGTFRIDPDTEDGFGAPVFTIVGSTGDTRIGGSLSLIQDPDVFPQITTTFDLSPSQVTDISYLLPATTTPTSTVEEGLLQLDAATGQLIWVSPTAVGPADWHLNGNSGTSAGADFLGTTDNQPLYLQVRNGGTVNNSLILNTSNILQRDAGGNARGHGAVDLSIGRTDPTQVASGSWATVGGGFRNGATGAYSTVAGGDANLASGFRSTVGGGDIDTASGQNATVAGGGNNVAAGDYSTVSGGVNNRAVGTRSTVGGGRSNVVNGSFSVVPGGHGMTIDGTGSFGFLGGNPSVPPGSPMTVAASNIAVFGNVDLWLANNTAAPSQLRLYESYATSGAFPNTANFTGFEAPAAMAADIEYILPAAAGAVGDQLTISAVAGTQVTLGWAAASDMAKKTDFLRLSGEDVLGRFRSLELGTWRYDPAIDPKGTRHYGIMAQDFHRAFGRDDLGVIGNDTTVTDIDLHGVSFLAIQGLETRTAEQAEEIERLRQENEELRRRIEAIEQRFDERR